jgi:uncharacterized membrane protein
MRYLLALPLVLIFLIIPAEGAIIHGTVYSWETLEPLPKAIVTINTTPEQRIVSENGTYSFVVPPGTYIIKAYYYSHGVLELYAEENITIKEEGTFVLDLILFPPLTNISVEEPNIQITLESKEDFPMTVVVGVLAVICVVGVAAYLYSRRRKMLEIERKEELPEDLKRVVEIIRQEGGRITQKELRQKLGYSEAKVSLIIADLERRGIVEKVKKGRGNIIFLRE